MADWPSGVLKRQVRLNECNQSSFHGLVINIYEDHRPQNSQDFRPLKLWRLPGIPRTRQLGNGMSRHSP